MDSMVLKYLGLAAITYGTHAYLAVAQILLSLYLITNGLLLFSTKETLGKWARRLGLITNRDLSRDKTIGLLMLATGGALILPLFGASYWIAVIACPLAIYLILKSSKSLAVTSEKKAGWIVRTGLLLSAIVVCGFTLWEERDLVYAGYSVNYKSLYWRNKEVSVWQQENNPTVPKVGEMAPDFELTDYSGTRTMRLSDYRGEKPVVLLFGSCTWPPFSEGFVRFLPIYKEYRDDVQFLMIYVREAHPTDKWWLAETKFMRLVSTLSNPYASYDTEEPKSIKERRGAATTWRSRLLEDMPVFVDNMDNRVNDTYVGWPTRGYFIDTEGKVKYDSDLEPYGLSPEDLEKEITQYLGKI